MKLNKFERYTAYCIMLYEATHRNLFTYGLCSISHNVIGDYSLVSLPELFKKRTGMYYSDGTPASRGRYFFKNWRERIAALKACIIETHHENN